MIKTKQQLERALGYKVLDNITCIGIDTASKSGIAIIKIKGNKVDIQSFAIKLPALPKDIEEKSEKYEQHLKDFSDLFDKELLPKLNEKENDILVLENSFMKVNVVTFGLLRAYQGILFEKLRKKFKKLRIVFPVTARKEVGFQSRLPKKAKYKDRKKEIMKWVSNVVEEEIKDDNCADALLLCFTGIKK
jgi:Holliday junction resolvasome RuvABC endonuclease subunit